MTDWLEREAAQRIHKSAYGRRTFRMEIDYVIVFILEVYAPSGRQEFRASFDTFVTAHRAGIALAELEDGWCYKVHERAVQI